MKKVLLAVLLSVTCAGPVWAEDKMMMEGMEKPKKEGTPQQQKMKHCNQSAKEQGLKGDERKKFMSECLSAKAKAEQ